MAFSPSTSEQRARLIREMSRDLSNARSNPSRPSSHASSHVSRPDLNTVSSFDPENEALMSTRQLDSVVKEIPKIRSSAQKYGQYNPPRPTDPINTSVLGRAFPDFSSANFSDEDDSMSIEVGRGGRSAHSKFHSDVESNPEISHGDDIRYEITATPPGQPNPVSLRTGQREQDILRRQAHLRRASLPLKDMQQTGKAGVVTLTDLHAKVTSEDIYPNASTDRPAATATGSKSTRFSNAQSRHKNPTALHNQQKTANAILKAMGAKKEVTDPTPGPQAGLAIDSATTTVNVTAQSFMLPDLPNITELVSGTYQDGTPVFSRHTRPRSRFMSASHARKPPPLGPSHAKLDSLPVPSDEKAIFASLQLLKDKVAYLEADKAEADQTIDEYEAEISKLKANLRYQHSRRRSDSALGTTDEDEEDGNRDLKAEKTRLESLVKSLQERLDRANRKVSVSDISLKRLTQERDSIVGQLGVAFYNAEELKAENDMLVKENEELKLQLAQLQNERLLEAEHWNDKETELVNKLERREETVREMQGLTKEIWKTRSTRNAGPTSPEKQRSRKGADGLRRKSATYPENETKMKIAGQVQEEIRKSKASRQRLNGDTQAQREVSERKEPRPAATRRVSARKTTTQAPKYEDETDLQSTTDIGLSTYGPVKAVRGTRCELESARYGAGKKDYDETLLSVMDDGAIGRLRKVLEDERAMLKKGKTMAVPQEQQEKPGVTAEREQTHTISRKASVKENLSSQRTTTVQFAKDEVTGRFSLPAASDDYSLSENEAHDATDATTRSKLNDDQSALSNYTKKRRSLPEMTSAFILPDITMSAILPGVDPQAKDHNIAASHEEKNCTVCHDAVPANDQIKTAPLIPTPIPVSSRMPEPSPGFEDPTIRPSQAPSLALATVLKELQDEIAHLRLELAAQEQLYNQHDPSLSKRKRKAVYERIQKLLKVVEKKSDQVYALYDVLEGQKTEEVKMGVQELEHTLRSVGIDVDQMREGKGVRFDEHADGDESGSENEVRPFGEFEDSLGSLGLDGP